MPWYWTDDLARLLITAGGSTEAPLNEWLSSPVAVRRLSIDPLEVARELAEAALTDGDALVA